jgi:Protein of unknown function (DUF1580)
VIDKNTEELLSPVEATKTVPNRRAGRPTNTSCIYRWMHTGCRGIKLEFIQIGGTRFTSREALDRFFTRLTNQATGSQLQSQPTVSKQRSIAAAEAELASIGL